jgi:hypothetical protein
MGFGHGEKPMPSEDGFQKRICRKKRINNYLTGCYMYSGISGEKNGQIKKNKKAKYACTEKQEKMAVACDLSGPHRAGGSGFL